MACKLVIGIFISICAIFVMSYNANAIDLTIDLDNYSLKRNATRPNLTLFWNNDQTSCLNVGQCRVYDTTDYSFVKKMATNNLYDAKANDIFILRMFVGSQSRFGDYTSITPFTQRNYTTNNDYLLYLGENVFKVDNENILSQLGYGPNANEFFTQISTIYQDLRIYEYYFRVVRDGNYNVGFDSTNYNARESSIFVIPAYSTNSAVYFQILGLTQYSSAESKENKEVEEKTQSAVDESAESGESSQGSVEGSTQNLMSAGASIISALSNAPATDCNINMTTSGSSSAFTGAIGSVNLCSGVPSGVLTMVQGIVALVFTPIVLYYTYSIITTIYKQFREYNS